ncbi:MAG: hypothetical protein D6808_03930 [Candidatus Dadabacteria bacterium]|nr:MAG: hypothetical protein D6808_03930 [Candidatus Dadabacteria bacterium]
MKKVYITLDCDPGELPENQKIGIEEAINGCLELFDSFNLTKDVTWFVNEAEVGFTSKYPTLLEQMAEGEIALHVHLNRPPHTSRYSIPADRSKMERMITGPQKRLDSWLSECFGDKKVSAFRSGNLLTSPLLFKVLEERGFKIDSSIPSQFDWSPREVARRFLMMAPSFLKEHVSRLKKGAVYKTLPLRTQPFRIGRLLEMPIHIYIGGRYRDKNWLENRTVLQLEGLNDFVIYWHPYELIQFGKDLYEGYLNFLLDSYHLKFQTITSAITR